MFGNERPKLPEQITITLTGEEAYVLLKGAIKGNLIYGAVASREGLVTLELVQRFAMEHEIEV